MPKFSIISECSIIKEKPQQSSNKIKYQEYIIDVDGIENSVYIPIRECSSFENVINTANYITEVQLKQLMREYRGIRNRDK